MTKKVAIILADEFEDIELTSPKEALENAGFETEIIGDTAKQELVGKHGEKVTVDISISDAKPENYDALLIPGGFHLTIYVVMKKDVMVPLLSTLLKIMYQHLRFVMVHFY